MNQEANMSMNNMMYQNNMNMMNMMNQNMNNMNMMNNMNQNNMNMMDKNNKNMMMMNGMGMNTMINTMNNMNQLQQMMMEMMKNENNNNNYNNNINFNNSVNQNNNNDENNNDLNDEKLTIIFQRNKKNENENVDFRIKIICKYDELVKDILDRYCFKTNEKKDDLLFLYNSANLQKKNLITVQSAGLINMSIILVIGTKQLIGGKFNLFNNAYFFNIVKS